MNDSDGLFQSWLTIEKKSKSQKNAISALNMACGTKYVESWPSKMASRSYSLERVPTAVRRYMMLVVLSSKFPDMTEKELKDLVCNLT
ncbi:hypothetical protein G3489_19260 [Shewanella baltica]|uniref:hypothetical protein n=1 Tax=Shewanella baltica TaxID=62322 RepID=UPI00217EF8B2|nr:hypothetical protein [Shewanella baltica]MCS6271815.1 hypothetical protein [Shewanella baltica]